MRILFVNDFDWVGGSGVLVHQQIEYMEKKGHEAYLAVKEKTKEGKALIVSCKEPREIFGHTWFPWNVKDPLAYNDTKRLLMRLKPDVVHFHNLFYLTLGPLLATKRLKVPRLVTVHDYWLICPKRILLKKNDVICSEKDWSNCVPGCSQRRSWVLRYEMKARYEILKHERIVAVSNAVKEALVRFGYNEEKIQVIKSGVNLDFYKPCSIRGNSILFIGRHLPRQKGLKYLIKAAEIVRKEYPQARFVMVGESTSGEKWKSENVEFVGNLPTNKLMEYYANCLALVVPSIWPEPFPLVALEAMACSKPVIAFASGGLKEGIVDGQTGFLIEPKNFTKLAEKILLLLKNHDLATEMGQKARRHAEINYPLQKMLESYEKTYEHLCKR